MLTASRAGPQMEQQIRFCTTSDGVRIAYATVGEGPPLVYATGWPVHLELEWEKPFVRRFLEQLADGFTLIRYDMRGSGLSDRDVTDLSLPSLVKDLEAVVDHLSIERFALVSLGMLGGPIVMSYAAADPARVTRLIVLSGYVRGSEIMSPDAQRRMIEYTASFGDPVPQKLDTFEHALDLRQLQKAAAPPRIEAALHETSFSVDVSHLLDRLSMPVLVAHARDDPGVPFALGRELAARLPGARFVPLEGAGAGPIGVSRALIPEIHRFLGAEVRAPAPEPAARGAPITILFTDVEGSTALTQRLGDAGARELLWEHERIVRDCLAAYGGSEVKTMGDGFMASFASASGALECAIAMQRAFEGRNESAPEPIKVRIGLNAGEPIAEDDPDGRGDLFGTAVNVAARIAAAATGGEILASNVVRELVSGKGFLFNDRGETELRGFEDPVRLYEVRWRSNREGQA